MMRLVLIFAAFVSVLCVRTKVAAFSLSMTTEQQASSRRGFLNTAATSAVAGAIVTAVSLQPTVKADAAAPTIYNLSNGIKYAVTKDVAKGSFPQEGDICAIEYTGYLSNGAIFDATHAEGNKKMLLFKLGSPVVSAGINSMVGEMKVGQKVQAIIPPELAFGDKGKENKLN
jgi:FKBP-type peptidyl-prolyl cis-trans isomerase